MTEIAYIDGVLYLGELDLHTKEQYLIQGEEKLLIPDIISAIYSLNGKLHVVSFKSALNNNQEAYYGVERDKVIKAGNEKIMFYQ